MRFGLQSHHHNTRTHARAHARAHKANHSDDDFYHHFLNNPLMDLVKNFERNVFGKDMSKATLCKETLERIAVVHVQLATDTVTAIRRSQRVSITDGDPLHPKNEMGAIELIKELKSRDYWINIEAAGTRMAYEVFDLVDFISFDFKTPSTGVRQRDKIFKKLNEQFEGKFQVKAVIENERDFARTLEFRNEVFPEGHSFSWCLTTCFNTDESFPLERFKNVIRWNEKAGGPFRVIGQQHKWLYGPNKKQV